MKVAILGAGAMGSVYAYYLSQRNDVTLLDISDSRVSDLQKNGLRIWENKNLLQKPCRVLTDSTGLGSFDLVVVFVKAMHTEHALEANRTILGSQTIVLSLQNGYGAWDRIARATDCTALCGISMHGATMCQDGAVRHTANGLTVIGSPDGTFLPTELAEEFSRCGLPTQPSDNIRQAIWKKVIINAGINGITALLRTKNAHLAQCTYAMALSREIVREAVQVANADGCCFDSEQMQQLVHDTAVITGQNLSSMLQDILYRRNTEVDVIYGAILQVARTHELKLPYTRAIYALIKSSETAIECGQLLQ